VTGSPWPPLFGEYDVLGTAATCSLVAGSLSLVDPFLTSLTGTLVALTFAGWCSRLGRPGNPVRRVAWRGRGLALAALSLAVLVSLAPPGPILPFRGVVLGAAVVPLWRVERSHPVGVVTRGAHA
jgi:hypothetical protein